MHIILYALESVLSSVYIHSCSHECRPETHDTVHNIAKEAIGRHS